MQAIALRMNSERKQFASDYSDLYPSVNKKMNIGSYILFITPFPRWIKWHFLFFCNAASEADYLKDLFVPGDLRIAFEDNQPALVRARVSIKSTSWVMPVFRERVC